MLTFGSKSVRGRREGAVERSQLSPTFSPTAMNRRVVREILIALAIFAGIVLAFLALAQFT